MVAGGGKEQEEGSCVCAYSPLVSLSLRLAGDGVHDGVLGVHADGRVVLGVNYGGLAPGAPHLDGLVGGQGRVFQCYGVEAGSILHTVRAGWAVRAIGWTGGHIGQGGLRVRRLEVVQRKSRCVGSERLGLTKEGGEKETERDRDTHTQGGSGMWGRGQIKRSDT